MTVQGSLQVGIALMDLMELRQLAQQFVEIHFTFHQQKVVTMETQSTAMVVVLYVQ